MKEEAPKVVAVIEYWDRKGAYEKITNIRDSRTQAALEKCTVVPMRPPQNPLSKLQDRLNTYHNIRHMRTDYKNYVRKYGTPQIEVPSEISEN